MMVNEEVFTATWYSYRLPSMLLLCVAVTTKEGYTFFSVAAAFSSSYFGVCVFVLRFYFFLSPFSTFFLLRRAVGFIFLYFLHRAYPFFPFDFIFEFSVVIYVLEPFLSFGSAVSLLLNIIYACLCMCISDDDSGKRILSYYFLNIIYVCICVLDGKLYKAHAHACETKEIELTWKKKN